MSSSGMGRDLHSLTKADVEEWGETQLVNKPPIKENKSAKQNCTEKRRGRKEKKKKRKKKKARTAQQQQEAHLWTAHQ